MYAAVVSNYAEPPRYAEVPAPAPCRDTELVVDVLAAGLHPRVRSQADGSHYTSTDQLPLVPGIDGVGRGADGRLRYFVLPDTAIGAMAEQTLIDTRRSVVLPDDCDPVAIAAAMNPAMSSWVALRRRIEFRPGQAVLVLGATGNAGQLAVQVAARLGAGTIVAAGRNAAALSTLRGLGATETVALDHDDVAERLAAAGAHADVVIDYLWGRPAADALTAIVPTRADDAQQLTWIQIGSVAGPTAPIPSAALRATRLQVLGSGQGSVATADILAELPDLARLITAGAFEVNARAVPLSAVEQAWGAASPGTRIVLTPQER